MWKLIRRIPYFRNHIFWRRRQPFARLACGQHPEALFIAHGWVYRIETGDVFAFDPEAGRFVPFRERHIPSITILDEMVLEVP